MTHENLNEIAPTIFVIFGATGDLAQNKLFPAFFDLFEKDTLPEKWAMVAFGRREFSDESYRDFVQRALVAKKGDMRHDELEDFLGRISYVRGDFNDLDAYMGLAQHLSLRDTVFKTCSNKLFYPAVPPTLYELIFNMLSKSGLTIPCGGNEGWTRILVEKPFGNDMDTATKLDRLLGKLFDERQIFRIDHYLAKETIQNILAFRFSNSIFESLWNRRNIEKIEINLFESSLVGSRAPFYDKVGALRDVGQNHLLAMLSLVAMEYPKNMTSDSIRSERAKVLASLKKITSAEGGAAALKARYSGYAEENGVEPDSKTETFFKIRAFVSNDRWRGVPFYLTSGKALDSSKTEVKVHFKKGKHAGESPNVLTFRIQPKEGISIEFWAKKPGLGAKEIYSKTLEFNYADSIDTRLVPDAYERVLYDCLRGDQTLFPSTKEVSSSWRFITPILALFRKIPMKSYKPGSSADDVSSRSGPK